MTLAHNHVPALDQERPVDDIVVLGARTIRSGTDPATLSLFDDKIWHITPAHPDAHLNVPPLRWERYPTPMVAAFKAFFLAALNHPYPPGPGSQRPGERVSVGTLPYWFYDLRVFAIWMIDHGISQICEATDRDLDLYRAHVHALARQAGRKADLLQVVRTFWLFGEHLPADARLRTDYPWSGTATKDLVPGTSTGFENKTPRIAADTMETLLAWALRMAEVLGPDILAARLEHRSLDNGDHPSQADYTGTLGLRLPILLDRLRADGACLPGKPGGGINFGAVLRMVAIPEDKRGGISPSQKRMLEQSGIPVADDTYLGCVTGTIDGRPWRSRPITVAELPTLVRLLYAACFIVVCYLSGLRPGEALNLTRGCRGRDPDTGELLIVGRRGKGFDRNALAPDDKPDSRPWVVVEPVHAAIGILESLDAQRFLFPASAHSAHAARPNEHNARSTAMIARDIEDFVAWVNATFHHGDSAPPIPPDPTKHLHATRFRRTLAYLIVRRPRGLIAAALQYGHVSTKITTNYAGRSDTSWTDELAVERLEMVLEQIDDDTNRLAAGEHVSGPSADRYRDRVQHGTRFAGRVVTGVRNAERILAQLDPNIHHGDAMTCVWRPETAACRQAKLDVGLPARDEPDETDCRSHCVNLAFTDRDIQQQERHAQQWEAAANDPLAPTPLRDRAAALAERTRAIIHRHNTVGPTEPTEGA